MLFRKKIKRSCAYCTYGTKFSDDQILCSKQGVVSLFYDCRKIQYDPCKRIPAKAKALNFKQYDKEDYTL